MTKKQVKAYAKKFLELERQLYKEDLTKEDKVKVLNKMDSLTEEVLSLDPENGVVNLIIIDDYIRKFL